MIAGKNQAHQIDRTRRVPRVPRELLAGLSIRMSDPCCLIEHMYEKRPEQDRANSLAGRRAWESEPARSPAFNSLRHSEASASKLFLEQAKALVEIAGRDIAFQTVGVRGTKEIVIQDAVREEIAVHMRWSFTHTYRRIEEARLILGPLEQTRQALSEGTISISHATAICAGVSKLSHIWDVDPDSREIFEAAARKLDHVGVSSAKSTTVSRTRRAVEKKLEEIDGLYQRRKRQAAASSHDVVVLDQGEGQAILLARMGMIQAQAWMAVINSHAQAASATAVSQGLSCDSEGALRSSALIRVLTGMAGETSNSNPKLRANIDIVIDFAALLGLQESMGLVSSGSRAPLSAPTCEIRDLISRIPDITIRRLVTDPLTNNLLDLGRRRYVPSKALRDFITVRDQFCRFPGCQASARRGHIDHANPWSQGGRTDRGNLGSLCVRHHQLKTHGGWRILESGVDGSATWRTPSGRDYSIPPPELPSTAYSDPLPDPLPDPIPDPRLERRNRPGSYDQREPEIDDPKF